MMAAAEIEELNEFVSAQFGFPVRVKSLQEAIVEMDAAQLALQRELKEYDRELAFARVMTPRQELEFVCAWCHPGDHRPNVTHGICPACKARMNREVPA